MEKKLANSTESNSRHFANYIKSKMKSKVSIGPLKSKDGKMITEESEIAKELNGFFSSAFTKEDMNTIPLKESETNGRFCKVVITESKIKVKIRNLKEKSAAGPDGIGARILKATSQEIAKPLSYIYRKSLNSGVVPADWRNAKVTPIFKKGPKGEPGNYRPVSLTSIPCRMLESLIKDDMMAHLAENNLIRDS